jgi:hypothetical protein
MLNASRGSAIDGPEGIASAGSATLELRSVVGFSTFQTTPTATAELHAPVLRELAVALGEFMLDFSGREVKYL